MEHLFYVRHNFKDFTSSELPKRKPSLSLMYFGTTLRDAIWDN